MRIAGAVILGYLAMVVVVFSGLTGAYLLLGADGAFQPGSFDVSLIWVIISVVVGFVAALLGGWTSRRVAGAVTGPRALAAVVVALGVVLALTSLAGGAPEAGVRAGDLGNMEAMQQARTPLWAMLLNPLIGAVGVLLGGRALGTARDRATDAGAEPVA
jgi:hypothetical protein